MRAKLLVLLCLSLALLSGPVLAAERTTREVQHRAPASADLFDYVAGANALEGQLLAPCCWNQTLDIHGSEIANDLRREIRQRLSSGESADAIKADIVSRYGERILAVHSDSALKHLATVLTLVFGAAGAGAIWLLVGWRRRARATTKAADGASPHAPDAWDERLDQELRDLES